MDQATERLAKDVVETLTAQGATVATAESCTGGLISAALTSVSGSSAVFTHGFVTYANEAKRDVLGVPEGLILRHGAVSGQVAEAMAEGARRVSGSDLAVSVTGVAGPGGGTPDKPVGLVWFGIASSDGTKTANRLFPPSSRDLVRRLSVHQALRMILQAAKP